MSVEFMFGTILVLQLCIIYALYKMWDTRFSSRYAEKRIAWLENECLTLWYMLRVPDDGSAIAETQNVKKKGDIAPTVALSKRKQATT